MNKYEELKIRYQNLIYLHDDYGNYGIIFHNFNPDQFKLYFIRYKFSDHGFVETVDYKPESIDKVNKLFGVKSTIKWNNTRRTIRIYKFNLPKFVEFLKSKNYDVGYMTKEEYTAIVKPRKKLIKPKRK